MSRELFINYIFARKKKFIRELENDLVVLRAKRKKLEQDLISAKKGGLMQKFGITENPEVIQNEICNIDRETVEVQKNIAKIMAGVETNLTQIENMQDVNTIRYFSDGMQIVTEDIITPSGNNWGKYVISISNQVRIKRLDGKDDDGVCHPFISRETPCFGVWASDINEAIHQGGLYTIAVASIKLLKCTTPSDAGPYMKISEFNKWVKRL